MLLLIPWALILSTRALMEYPFFMKDQGANILGFDGHIISISHRYSTHGIAQKQPCIIYKQVDVTMLQKKKCYLQKEAVGEFTQ